MKFNSIYNNFSSGELSRYLKGRTDLEDYYKGVEDMTNFIPQKQGGAFFRPGSILSNYFGATNSDPYALFEFKPRDNESYIVALHPSSGSNQIKITTSEGTSCSITKDNYIWNTRPDFSTASTAYNTASTKYERLQIAQRGDIMIIVDGDGELAPIIIGRTAANTFVVNSFILPSTVNSATNRSYFDSRAGTTFFGLRVPYKDTNINNNLRLKPSATSGGITITAEDASAVAVNFFVGDVVGTWVKITHTTTTGMALITAKGSDSSVTATVYVNFGATTASSNFETSSWNPVDGYPSCISFYEGRLVLASSKNEQDSVWNSLTGNIYHFMQRRLAQDSSTDVSGAVYFGTAKDSDPFNFIPASVSANKIQWLFSADTLLAGSSKSEYSISGGPDSLYSLSNVFVKTISTHGSSKVQPVRIGGSVMFVSQDGRKLLEIPKNVSQYTSAIDVSSPAEGIIDKALQAATSTGVAIKTKNKIIKMAWQENESLLWVLCKNSSTSELIDGNPLISDGGNSLITLTLDATSKTIAWAKHTISYYPKISSMCISSDSYGFRLNLNIKRSGATYYSHEHIHVKPVYDAFYIGDLTDYFESNLFSNYLDAASMYEASDFTGDVLSVASSSIINGMSVSVIGGDYGTGDVEYFGEFTVTGGNITVPSHGAYDWYVVGIKYNGLIKTMPIEAGAQFGVAQGSARRTHEISIFVDRSMGGSYKQSISTNEFDILTSAKATSSALYTGEVKLASNANPFDPQLEIKQTVPFPLNVIWLLSKGYTYDT